MKLIEQNSELCFHLDRLPGWPKESLSKSAHVSRLSARVSLAR